MDDSLLQAIIWSFLGLSAIVAIVGGQWPRVGGTFTEGDHIVLLHHVGPVVWGVSTLVDGEERYLGLVFAGRLHLRRRDYGARHLLGRGFPQDQVAGLEGACTGFFSLRLQPEGHLHGSFFGRRFQAQDDRMVAVEMLAPVQRRWQRPEQT